VVDKDYNFIFWEDTDYDDDWTDEEPKVKEKGKTIED
jgi:hypothetical protein